MRIKNTQKCTYIEPRIVLIKLDNEISLTLESTPPVGPDEGFLEVPDSFKSDPFKTNIV